MRTYKKPKMSVLIICVCAVMLLTIGFASYSTSLMIKSKLSVNPDTSNFSVVFSSSSTELKTDPVVPTVIPVDETNTLVTATSGTIDNSSVPTLSNLSLEFSEPGDKVEYVLYARNTGSSIAYLTGIVFNNVNGKSTYKSCEAIEGTSQSSVDNVCDDIVLTVKVGSETVTNSKLNITDHQLGKNSSEMVTITIEYLSSGDLPDGDFIVKFGDISLTYSSLNGQTPSTSDSSGSYAVGDVVTLGGESFYVIESTNTTVTLLAKYNLTIPGLDTDGNPVETPIQSEENAGNVAFSSTNYWGEVENGTFVYNSSSLLYPYVEAYKNYLINRGVNVLSASIPSKAQLENLDTNIRKSNGYDWYWTGSAYGSNVWLVAFYGAFLDDFYAGSTNSYDGCRNGLRPVITINASDIQ